MKATSSSPRTLNGFAMIEQAQLLMVAGFLMLGWVLARRQIRFRKRVNQETRIAKRELAKIREDSQPSLPLSDAPPETQRWQVAMFDLQRELKAELDTRISIVQSLIGHLDERIARLGLAVETDSRTEASSSHPAAAASAASSFALSSLEDLEKHRAAAAELVGQGHTATDISQILDLPVGDVELILASNANHSP